MTEYKRALVYVSVTMVSGMGLLKKIATKLRLISSELDFSSVYRQCQTEDRFDFSASMVTVLKCRFDGESEGFVHQLNNLEVEFSSPEGRDRVRAFPLAIEQETSMTPELTLPHPLLHTDSLATRCAAEVWGNYEHPVLRKTLHDLARSAPAIVNAEFLLQGKTLTDRP